MTPQCGGARLPRGPKILVRIYLHNSLHAPLAFCLHCDSQIVYVDTVRSVGVVVVSCSGRPGRRDEEEEGPIGFLAGGGPKI